MGKKILIAPKQQPRVIALVKPPAPRPLNKWLTRAAECALMHKAALFALWHGKRWHIYHAYGLKSKGCAAPLNRSFPTQEAAEMWLIHKEQSGGQPS